MLSMNFIVVGLVTLIDKSWKWVKSELIEAHAWHVVTTFLTTMVLRKMETQGAVGPFVPQCVDWVLYTECLQQWFVANDVQDANEQRAVFSTCGASMYRLISNLVTPHKPRESSWWKLSRLTTVLLHQWWFSTTPLTVRHNERERPKRNLWVSFSCCWNTATSWSHLTICSMTD